MDTPFGAYAGYVWFGRVSSVYGTWRVPSINAASRPGLATTWIGAQGEGVGAEFIQVGTAEQCGYSTKHAVQDRYWAFWGDKARNYHLERLFAVKAGDDVAATAALSGRGWSLTVRDYTSGKIATLDTTEAPKSLTAAQWTQEDIASSSGARYNYPLMSLGELYGLRVNSTIPSYRALYSTWMSIDGIYLAPGPLQKDSFVLKQTKLTAIGKRYLALDIGESHAVLRFGEELDRWNADTPRKTLVVASSRLTAALSREVRSLKNISLPAPVNRLTMSLSRKLHALSAQAQEPMHLSVILFSSWRNQLARDASEARYLVHLIRRALGLPELL